MLTNFKVIFKIERYFFNDNDNENDNFNKYNYYLYNFENKSFIYLKLITSFIKVFDCRYNKL